MDSLEFKNTHKDYEKEFHIFQNNVDGAARAFHYNVALNKLAKADTRNVCILNDNAWFWNDFRHYTVITVFILLGRIFDKPKKARNIHKFINKVKTTPYFNRINLRARKEAASSNAHEWIDEYMRNTHVLGDSDFDQMANYIGTIESEWNSIEDVRHKIIAHQEIFPNEHEQKKVLEQSDATKIESIIQKLLIIEHILLEAGLNGRKPDYDYVPRQMKELAEKELNKMISLLSAGCTQAIGDAI